MESAINYLKISDDGMTETVDTHAGFNPTEPRSAAATPRNANASLDGLPAELKALILHSVPSVSALQTLVRSSPLYHKVYLDKRKVILPTVLRRDMGTDVLADALAVHKASQIGFDRSGGRKDSVKSFLVKYDAERGLSSLATYDSLDMGTLESLSRLQLIVTKIAFDFCEMTLSVRPVTGERIQSHGDLSPNEKRRIYRALYRFELFGALFNPDYDPDIPWEHLYPFDEMDQSFLFLHLFNVWEVEQLACVRDYLIRRHTEILLESSSELSKLRPNKDLKSEYYREENAEHLMSLGLQFLYRLLNASSTTQKASILEWEIFCDSGFLTKALKETPYDFVYPTDVSDAYENGQELLFEDDSLVDGPNAAWPWSTYQKLEIMHFEEWKEPLRKWAYVMWDLGRLEDWRILDLDPKLFFGPGYAPPV